MGVRKMKQTQKIVKKLYRPNLLAASIAALCTAMIATSVTQASDIDIYQEAKSGDVTLMMLFDVSGSMGAPQSTGDASACDIPSDTSVYSNSSENSSNGSPIYTRYYCTAKADIYFYKRSITNGNSQYFKCGTNGTTATSGCTSIISGLPSDASGMTTSTSGNNTFYYKPKQTGKYYDRITRLKDAMFDLLYGNLSKGIEKITDDKVIGLSAYSINGTGGNGYILVPARRLAENVTIDGVTKKQRQVLLDAVANKLYARGGTPTANAYAEVAAYLMGTKTYSDSDKYTFNNGVTEVPVFFEYTQSSSTKYVQCNAWNTNGSCSDWAQNNNSTSRTENFLPLDLSGFSKKACNNQSTTDGSKSGSCYYYSANKPVLKPVSISSQNRPHGFNYSLGKKSDGISYQKPSSLEQTDDNKSCSGQAIYVLTDGAPSIQHNQAKAMQNALNGASLSCTEQAGDGSNAIATDCSVKFSQKLLSANNPSGVVIKTAVVGFGGSFNSVAAYDREKDEAANLDALGLINSATKAAAEWGIKGGGGWYSGNSSQDIVDSVNNLIDDLGSDIPAVTTGSPTIPKDALNPAILQDDAYYQQFQPTPDKSYGLWVGNLKKYAIASSGRLQGRNSADVTDSRGGLVLPTYVNGKLTSAVYDFWSTDVDSNATIADGDENTIGSKRFAAKGGMWSQLKLRTASNGTTVQRKLLTNRVGTGTGTGAIFTSSNSTLKTVNLDYLTDITYKDDPNRGYLISLLGYNVDAANPNTITTSSLATSSELRQVGAVMHSLPVLVTNKGKVTYNATTKKIGSTNREDYVLFGTTQGLLHVVDAITGQEKFAFVPNEMVEKQKQGFQNYTTTTGGMNGLYYGVDGPWSLYTQYVIDTSGNLTVGKGKGTNQYGKQLAYGGLRMGGRSYYSLDLQDINSPTLQFHINPDANTTGPLSYMGQSWSKPTIGYVNWGGTRKMVMFVGGGYDADGATTACNSAGDTTAKNIGYECPAYDQTNRKGAGVYMFSAEGSDAGSLLWWASDNATTSAATTNSGTIGTKSSSMKYSVVNEIRAVDRNGDDLIDHLYFGDLGGQVFRVDLDNAASKLGGFAKAPVRLLNLHAGSGKSPRFYDMPSFSIYNEKGKTFAVISVGSGNRSKPLQNYTTGTAGIVNDAVYSIYDKDVARKDLLTATSWNTQDIITLAEVTNTNFIKAAIKDANGKYVSEELVAPFSSTNGWYYKFANCVTSSDGTRTGCSDYKLQSEKVFGTPLAMNYRLYVSTFDSSKPGISGDCGAGVKGESFLTTFCMPYGQCSTVAETGNNNGADPDHRGISIGIGIQNVTTGNCVGAQCGGSGGGSQNNGKVDTASNYCASTGGRILVTTTGNTGGSGQATQMCLIPQRWYEKNTFIK